MAENQMKEVQIEAALNGWIVHIGCATVVALSKEAMLSEIGRYIDNPSGVEAEYAANAVNRGTYQPDEGPMARAQREPRSAEAEGCDETPNDEGPSLSPSD